MYYFPNPSPPPAGLAAAEVPVAGQAALSPAATQWVRLLQQPEMWCEPKEAAPLMQALGEVLRSAPGLDGRHELVVGDLGPSAPGTGPGRSSLHGHSHGNSNGNGGGNGNGNGHGGTAGASGSGTLEHPAALRPQMAVVMGFDDASPSARDCIHAYVAPARPTLPIASLNCGRSGDSFFVGLAHVLHATGQLVKLIAHLGLAADRSEHLLRQWLVQRLAARSPQVCESLASAVRLQRMPPPRVTPEPVYRAFSPITPLPSLDITTDVQRPATIPRARRPSSLSLVPSASRAVSSAAPFSPGIDNAIRSAWSPPRGFHEVLAERLTGHLTGHATEHVAGHEPGHVTWRLTPGPHGLDSDGEASGDESSDAASEAGHLSASTSASHLSMAAPRAGEEDEMDIDEPLQGPNRRAARQGRGASAAGTVGEWINDMIEAMMTDAAPRRRP